MLRNPLAQSLPDFALLRWRAHAPSRNLIDAAQAPKAFIAFGMHGAHRYTG
jgi:hypothetical protein